MSDTLGLNEHGAISTCLLPFSFGNNEIYGERGGDIYIYFFFPPLTTSFTSTPHMGLDSWCTLFICMCF